MENEKQLLDEKTVEGIRKSKTAGFIVVLSFLGLTIVLGAIFVPFPINLAVFLVCGGLMALVIVLRIKHGKLNVYFKEVA